MATKYGFEAFNNTININNENSISQALASLQGQITAVRVKSIILDASHPRFKELGEWNALGVIEYQQVDNPLESPQYSTAAPLYPNLKNYPLINLFK